MKDEKILDIIGHFIQTPTNIRIAQIAYMIENEEQVKALSYENSYKVSLTLVLKKTITINEAVKDLKINENTCVNTIKN